MFFIILLLFFIYLVKKNLTFIFLDHQQASQLIYKHHQPYLKKMKPLELTSKYINPDKNIQQQYIDFILEFTKKEKQYLKYLVHFTLKHCNWRLSFIRHHFKEWKFMKVSNLCESGLPHTIHNTIVFSQDVIDKIIFLIQHQKWDILIKHYGSLLLHEQIHIWQKKSPNTFYKLYTQKWNYVYNKKFNTIIEQYTKEKQRLNPDGLDTNWAFKINENQYLITIVLIENKDVSNISKYGLLLNKNLEVLTYKPLKEYLEFMSFFGNIHNNYHPNELSASFMSENILLPQYYKHNQSPAIQKINEWLTNIF